MCRTRGAGYSMLLGELVLSEGASIDLDQLRKLLAPARERGLEALSAWAELAIEWAAAAEVELVRLRPKPGQAHIEGDALVTAAGRRYCLKHLGFELHGDGCCIRCGEISAWLENRPATAREQRPEDLSIRPHSTTHSRKSLSASVAHIAIMHLWTKPRRDDARTLIPSARPSPVLLGNRLAPPQI
jgi:hypothetical protein